MPHRDYAIISWPMKCGWGLSLTQSKPCCGSQSFLAEYPSDLLQLSQYNLKARTPRAVKRQAIADLLAQFLGEEEFLLDDEDPRKVAMAGEVREQWIMKFDGSSTTQSGVVRVVLYHEEDKVVVLSFKLEFSCSNNTVEYEAYLTGLATTLEIGINH